VADGILIDIECQHHVVVQLGGLSSVETNKQTKFEQGNNNQ